MTAISDAKKNILDTAAALGLTMEATFVPWSRSRNKNEKHKSLNWSITIKVRREGGRQTWPVLTTDYSAGIGHGVAYNAKGLGMPDCIMRDEAIAKECETGRAYAGDWKQGPPLMPDLADVLHSLTMDAGAIDYATFEDWASEYGYEEDSRKAEAIYRACLDIGLKLRSVLGHDGLAKLREACEGY